MNPVYFYIILIFYCFICLFFVMLHIFYNKKYLTYMCGSNICVSLTIMLLLLYTRTNEYWVLKGLTAVTYTLGVLLTYAALQILLERPIKKSMVYGTIGLMIADFIAFTYFIEASIFFHKVILMGMIGYSCILLLMKEKKLFFTRLLAIFNILMGCLQVYYFIRLCFVGPVHLFWDNFTAIIQNFVSSMLFIFIMFEESRKTYVEQVDQKDHYIKQKNNFFADLSHDLRTPVHMIYSYIQLFENDIKRGEVGEAPSEEHLKNMKKSCYQLIKLVNQIIEINQIDAGAITLNKKNYYIIGFLEEVITCIVPYAREKNIEVLFDTEEEELMVACDMNHMEKIMLNLLANAIKYTPEGGSVNVRLQQEGTMLLIHIQDTGIGIPEALCEEVFKRFAVSEGEHHKKCESSGLGLSVVKALVELHGGSIWVDKQYKKGCKMIFTLPLEQIEGEEGIWEPDYTVSLFKLQNMMC